MADVKRLPKRFLRMCEVYRLFATDYTKADFSEKSARELYEKETFGHGREVDEWNGFAIGLSWMNVTVAAWLKALAEKTWPKLLLIQELYDDPKFANFHWWLDDAVKKPYERKMRQQ